MELICKNLRHKTLAFVIQQAREKRKNEEAREESARLANDLQKGTN